MRVLLDTHAFLWFVLDDPQLSEKAKSIIEEPTNEVLISPATYWEIATKVRNGKLDLRANYDDFLLRGIQANEFEILPIRPTHTSRLTTLPLHHKDPFDRLLIVQSLVENIPLISVDDVCDLYGLSRLW